MRNLNSTDKKQTTQLNSQWTFFYCHYRIIINLDWLSFERNVILSVFGNNYNRRKNVWAINTLHDPLWFVFTHINLEGKRIFFLVNPKWTLFNVLLQWKPTSLFDWKMIKTHVPRAHIGFKRIEKFISSKTYNEIWGQTLSRYYMTRKYENVQNKK